MELIRKLDTRLPKNPRAGGVKWERWALFECPYCLSVVEKMILNGLRNQSCGCSAIKLRIKKMTKHGDSKKTRIYRIWSNMKSRCYVAKSTRFRFYGEKGIKVCDDWKNSYIEFKKWALSHGYSKDLVIDRVDSNLDYCPENCRWITAKLNNHFAGIKNRRFSVKEISKIRELYKNISVSQRMIAKVYSTSQTVIGYIVNNKTYQY